MITASPYYVACKKSLLSSFPCRRESSQVANSVSKLAVLDRVFFRLTGVVQCAASLDSRLRGNDEVEI